MNEIWTISEQKQGQISRTSLELLSWGKEIDKRNEHILCAVLLVDEMETTEIQKLIEYGADKVYLVIHKNLEHFLVDSFAEVITDLIMDYQPKIVLASASTTGRTIMPYVSAKVHGGLTADCTELEFETGSGLLLQTRPAIGGNILATIKTPAHTPQMATVRPKSIACPVRDTSRKGEIKRIKLDFLKESRTKFEGFIPFSDGVSNIEDANVVVSGGRGLGRKDSISLIEELAALLDGETSSSRPPVDLGWKPYATQIGLSGKTVTPELYIACGISGSIQHLAGIKTAKHILAINKDPLAQIFQVANLGIVADLFEFLPFLIQKIKAIQQANVS